MTGAQRSLLLLWWLQCLSMGAMELTGPFWPLHLRTLASLSDQALALTTGLIYLGPLLAAMVSAPFWGRLGDRLGHKPMVIRALLALALTQALAAFTDSIAVLVVVRLVQGACAGFIAAAQAYALRLSDADRRGAVLGQLQSATALGSLLGPLLGGLALSWLDFRALFLGTALLCLLCAAVGARWLVVVPTVAAAAPTDRKALARAPLVDGARGLLLVMLFVQCAKMMPQIYFTLFTTQVLQLSPLTTGLCYAASALTLMLSAPAWGHYFDRLDEPAARQRLTLVTGLAALTMLAQALATGVMSLLIARLLWGVTLGALLPVLHTLLLRQVDPAQHGQRLGQSTAVAKAGALLGTGLGALSLAVSPGTGFWLTAALYLGAALLLARQTRTAAGLTEAKVPSAPRPLCTAGHRKSPAGPDPAPRSAAPASSNTFAPRRDP